MIQALLEENDSKPKRRAIVNGSARVVGCSAPTRAKESEDATGSNLSAHCT